MIDYAWLLSTDASWVSSFDQYSCPKCNGEGRIVTKKCHVCSGTKISTGKDFLVIVVEKGVVHGHVYEYAE